MPRGRPQRKGTRQRYKPTDRRPRETVTRATDDAGSGRGTDEWPALPHPRRSTAMASRWDEENAGNWSAVVLRQKIEARGLKLPASMKKAQMLNIFLDNFNDEDQAASSSSTTGTTSDPPVSPEAVLPPEPQPCSPEAEPQPRSPEAAPEPPRSRWSIAANLNSIATRARQIHQRAGSLQATSTSTKPGQLGDDESRKRSSELQHLLQLSLKSTRPFPPVLSVTAARSHWPMLFTHCNSRSVRWPIRCESFLGLGLRAHRFETDRVGQQQHGDVIPHGDTFDQRSAHGRASADPDVFIPSRIRNCYNQQPDHRDGRHRTLYQHIATCDVSVRGYHQMAAAIYRGICVRESTGSRDGFACPRISHPGR